MSQTTFRQTVQISASTPLVWLVMADIERWPEWTASISLAKKLSTSPLQIGSRVRIHQPGLPPALWQVTDLNQGISFTWVGIAPGICVTA